MPSPLPFAFYGLLLTTQLAIETASAWLLPFFCLARTSSEFPEQKNSGKQGRSYKNVWPKVVN